MIDKYSKVAINLQKSVMEKEDRQHDYNEDQVKSAVVHARHDIVLMTSYLHSLNRQVKDTKYLLAMIVLVLILILIKIV